MTDRFDAVVVGAGLAGRFAALALASRGFDVLLCDRRAMGDPPSTPRTTALAPASTRALRRLNAWDAVAKDTAPVRDIVVANGRPSGLYNRQGRGAVLSFSDGLLSDTERWEGTPLAHVVPNDSLAHALEVACRDADGITERTGTVEGTKAGTGGATITFADGSSAEASMIVACDGRRSPLRRRAGLRAIERDYGQDALTFTLGHTEPHRDTARQLFLPGGPIAALPLPGDRSSIVWSMPRRQADAFSAEPDVLAGMTERHFPEIGRVSDLSLPARFPLGFLFSPEIIADRLALVGEAGRAIHPIAGQGLNLAIADAAMLADVAAWGRGLGLDPGHGSVLAEYDRRRRIDATAMAFGTNGLARMLSSEQAVTRRVTEFGFDLVQRSESIRRAFVRRASGDLTSVPSLLAPDV